MSNKTSQLSSNSTAQRNLIPPHDLDAEKSVLGAVLISEDALIKVVETLKSEHFYKSAHASIYEAVLNLYEKRQPIDLITLPEELKKHKLLTEIGGLSYLTELVNFVPTASNVEFYAKIIVDNALRRSLITASAKINEMAFDKSEVEGLLDEAEQEIYAVSQDRLHQDFVPISDTLQITFERLDELSKTKGALRGVPTGLKGVDRMLSGFQRENLIILAARPSVGKSSFAINCAQYAATTHKKSVGIFSLEMGREQLVDRMISAQGDIDNWRITTGNLHEEDFEKYGIAAGELAEAPIYIDDTPGIGILELRTKARRLHMDKKIDLVIVDYLQLIHGRTTESRTQEVSEISQALKNLARELKIPVLALSQLSRAVEIRGGDKRPQLSDLRDSGCLLGDTLITLADSGKRIPIKDLVGKRDFDILAVDDDFKLKPAKASRVFSSGKKQVYRLTTVSGKQITASANHPFLTLAGWVRLDGLKIGDAVATPNYIQIQGLVGTLNDNKLILLAHLLGDGCFVERQPLHYTNSEMELINIVKDAARVEFNIEPRIVPQESWFHLYLSAKEKLTHNKRNPIVKWLDEEMGIYGLHSYEKFVPDAVFALPPDKIALFLKHLWATDGCIYTSKTAKSTHSATAHYSTNSIKLARGVSHLLLRLGIISTIQAGHKKGYKDVYMVTIQDKDNLERFLTKVGCTGTKATKVKEALAILVDIKGNPNNNIIPKSVWSYIKRVSKEKGFTTRSFAEELGIKYNGTAIYNNGIGRERLLKIAKILKDDYLTNLATSDVYWDKVKSIEKLGLEEVYDMTVPGMVNFVANDILVHNSIEQDADVVMFLFRPNEEDRINHKLLIAKHRNGPTGEIDLFFKADRTRFFEAETKIKDK